MERKHLLVAVVGVILLGAGTTYAIWREGGIQPPYERLPETATTTESEPPEPTVVPEEDEEPVTPFGEAGLSLGETGSFAGGLSVRPLAVLEDSRCPRSAQCIQAGTVKVSVRISSGLGVSTNTFEPGTTITTEAESVTLLSVSPEPVAGQQIPLDAYRFLFEVRQRPGGGVIPAPQGRCYVTGCSSQLCTDDPDVASTCEYRAEYACYRSARCERQASGDCGWTQTPALTACLADPPEIE